MASPEEHPAKKRARTNGDRDGDGDDDDDDDQVRGGILDPISPSVLARAEELAASYGGASPYPHGVVRGFCRPGFLEGVLAELKEHTKVTFKETDLFRVYQSIDLVSGTCLAETDGRTDGQGERERERGTGRGREREREREQPGMRYASTTDGSTFPVHCFVGER